MAHNGFDGCVLLFAAVIAQEGDGEVHAYHPVGVPDGIELAVGEVARRRAECVSVGMARHERRIRDPGYVPEAPLVEMREVNQNTEPVTLSDELSSRTGQARAGIGRSRKPEGDAMRVSVGAAPHEAERAESRLIERFKRSGVRAKVLGSLEVQHRSQHAITQARL